MSEDSNSKTHRDESLPTRTFNLIEKLISQEIEVVAGSEPLEAEGLPERRAPGIAVAEEREQDPAAELSQHTRDQLREVMQGEEFQKLLNSPPQAVRYLLNNFKVSDAVESGLLLEPAVGVTALFNLDEIPPLGVWHGSKCEFLVIPMGKPDAELSVKVSFYSLIPNSLGSCGSRIS